MKHHILSFVVGLLFALGLGISGMTRPEKVIGFLDVTGSWDPSLLLVMGGAVVVYAVVHRLAIKRPAPILGGRFAIPSRRDLDSRLLVGAALFGIGWGLGGMCPGPGLTNLVTGSPRILAFVLSMFAGMWLFKLWDDFTARKAKA